jgi:hypothetical protein
LPPTIWKHRLAMLSLAFALATLASPGHAQNGRALSAARAAAIHECSVSSGRYIEHTWGDFEIQLYRSCMAQHGQPE